MSEEPEKFEEPIAEYRKLDLEKLYTYWDYLKWTFTERVELIRGKVVRMSPAPGEMHQSISGNLSYALAQVFRKSPCRLYVAPFDVRLPVPKATKDSTVVQPDLCIICDETKIDERGCNGAPDLMVEILSPGNSRHDTAIKFELYEISGVKEYWIIEPAERVVLVYTLRGDKYVGLHPFAEGMTIESPLFPELRIPVDEIFYRVRTFKGY